MREDLPFTILKPKAKILTYLHNAEVPFANQICHRENIDRGFKIHKEKLKKIKTAKKTAYSAKGTSLKFLDDAISKSFHAQEEAKRIMGENLALERKLQKIGGMSSTAPQGSVSTASPQRVAAQPMVSKTTKLKQDRRRRENERISRENLKMLKRLNNVKPEYSVKNFRKQRKKESNVLKLRRTNYTAGHILSTNLEPIRKSRLKALQMTSFSEASVTSLTSGLASKSSLTLPNGSLVEPGIYVDPEALKHLPKSPPSSRQRARPKLRKNTPDKKHRGPHRAKNSGSPTFEIPPQRLSRDLDGGRVSPLGDDISVNTQNSTMSASTVQVFSKPKDFIVFGVDKDRTTGCLVDVSIKEPFDGSYTVKVVSKSTGQLASKTLSQKDVSKIEAWHEANSVNSTDVAEIHELLISLFKEADVDGTKTLAHDEFIACMEKAELGISSHELHLVMAEADDNDDGVIDYDEFVPIALDLIQAFKARAHARRKQQDQTEQIDEEALKLLYTDDLNTSVKVLIELLEKIDGRRKGSVSRSEFKQCVNDPMTGFNKIEASMIENLAPRDKFGRFLYNSIAETVTKVRLTTIKNAIIETQASDIQKYLMDMCRDQEREDSATDFADALPDSEFPYTGQLTDRKISLLLQNANMLSLNRLQVLAIMCEAEVVDGMVDYWTFVPIASKAIENMFEPAAIAQRASLVDHPDASEEAIFDGRQRDEVESLVRERFRHADTDRSGALNPVEFSKCMESLELGLTRSQVHALMRDADADGNGEIDIDEFIQLFYDRILFLEREKKIKELQKAVFEETSNLLADGRSKSTSRRGLLGSSDPKDSEEDKLDDAAVLAMEEMLINLFTKADFGCSGYLTATEFRSILDSLDLGVTSFQQTILMAEADVNEDGKIQYGEFVPVCAELLQAFKAKAAAERGTIEAEKDIEDKVKIYISNNKNLLKAKITSVQINLSEADKERTGKMSRKDVTQLLRGNQTLEKSEVNMILHSLPVDDNGIVEYNGIDRIMEEVFEANVRRKYQDELPHSSLESHLVQLLEDEERRLRKEEETALAEANGGGRSPSSMQEEKLKKMRGAKNGLVNLDFDDEMEDGTIGSVLSVTAGFLPASSIYDALKHAKHLRLSRVQLLAVMSLAHVDEGSMEEIPYKTFAGTAAEMITKFYDPREIKRRALLERRTDMNPLNLLNGVSREDMKSRLMDNLVRIDQKKRGNVSEEMFRQTCNKCLEQCELTSSDISALVASAPRNSAGRIVWKNYIEQVYDIVLNMKRERVLQGSDIEVEEALEEDLLIVPPSKKVIASLTRALYEQVSLESRRGDITIHFSESQSAAISGDEAGGMAHKSRERHSMMLMAGTSGHKDKRSSSLEVLSATKEDMFEEVELFAEQKILYVVDDQGRPLNTQGGVYYSGVKGAVMDTMELWVTVRTLNSQDEEFQRIQIEGCKRKGGACVLEKIFKMPCLAVADNEAAEDFAANLTAGLKILQSEDGGRSFKF